MVLITSQQETMLNKGRRSRRDLRSRHAAAASGSHAFDESIYPIVDGLKGVLTQDCALRLVVELEVDPVDGEVTTSLLRAFDELPAKARPRSLRRHTLALEYL